MSFQRKRRSPRKRGPWALAFGALAAGAILVGACAADERPPFDSSVGGRGRDAAPVDPFADSGATRPECQLDEDGGPCGCLELSLLSDAPNLYFVLDRSGSMGVESGPGGAQNQWETIRLVLSRVVTRLGPRIRFGATVFPSPAFNSCSTGQEVMPLTPGDAPAGTPGPAVARFVAATNVGVGGATPLAGTLRELVPKLVRETQRTFVILATDGGPNCNFEAECEADGCIYNIESASPCTPDGPNCCTPDNGGGLMCLDREPTRAAVASLRAAGVAVYVVGVPGSAPYASLLDELAEIGGTARPTSPKYYRVDGKDPAAFETALAQIAAKITANCRFPLDPAPPDPSRVNVYFDDRVVAPGDDGWALEDGGVTLTGSACARVLAGEVLNVRVIAGCPTVPPR